MLVTPERKNAIGLSILNNHLLTHPGGTYEELMQLVEDESDEITYWDAFGEWDTEDFYNYIDTLVWDIMAAVNETEYLTMYTVSRAIEGVTLNGKEYLLDEVDEWMTFTLEEALSMTGYSSIEDAEEDGIYIEEEDASEILEEEEEDGAV